MAEPYKNNHLFSNYYLKTHLNEIPEWRKDEHIKVFEEIKKIYYNKKKLLETYNEAQVTQPKTL